MDVSVKINAEVYRNLRTVAAWKGLAVSEYLSQIVGQQMALEMAKLAQEIATAAVVPTVLPGTASVDPASAETVHETKKKAKKG